MILKREELQALKAKIKRIQGDFCYLHPKYYGTVLSGTEHFTQHHRDFDLEHKNDDRNDYRIENLGLSCHSCNCKKRNDRLKSAITQPKVLYMREGGEERKNVDLWRTDYDTLQRMSPEMKKSERSFPVFEEYIKNRVAEESRAQYDDTLHSACYVSKIKIKTGREWMKLVSSSMGSVQVVYENDEPKWVIKRENKNVKGVRS